MAESRMGEEEGHGNLKLEMTKEVRKNVNVTMMMNYFSGRCAGYSLLPARHYGAVYGVDGGDGSEGAVSRHGRARVRTLGGGRGGSGGRRSWRGDWGG